MQQTLPKSVHSVASTCMKITNPMLGTPDLHASRSLATCCTLVEHADGSDKATYRLATMSRVEMAGHTLRGACFGQGSSMGGCRSMQV
ncbi:hypothetical protein HaLaN_14108 [Haematococcus lacustris]|uniref:Uncharacterized protein n=1 Tax=Haematococcus lacustris TaxID=44745 RepID=A0A699ZF03_HAELA|nr:hypothetical protein HaLaN_14108 [Haematococcus lacustris]